MSVDRERGIAIVNDAMSPQDGDTVFGQRWGNGEIITITPKEVQALMVGKLLALDVEGEYVVYLQLDEDSKD